VLILFFKGNKVLILQRQQSVDSSKARFEKICFWQFASADFVAGRIGMI